MLVRHIVAGQRPIACPDIPGEHPAILTTVGWTHWRRRATTWRSLRESSVNPLFVVDNVVESLLLVRVCVTVKFPLWLCPAVMTTLVEPLKWVVELRLSVTVSELVTVVVLPHVSRTVTLPTRLPPLLDPTFGLLPHGFVAVPPFTEQFVNSNVLAAPPPTDTESGAAELLKVPSVTEMEAVCASKSVITPLAPH